MNNSLKHEFWKLPQEQLKKLNSPVSVKETELIVKNFPTKSPDVNALIDEFY